MKYLSKVRCYTCNQFGHYASQCLNKKKGGKGKQDEMAASNTYEEEELDKKFKDEFLLVSHLSESTIHESDWFLKNGSTRHMTGT
jgi:hypothetical protein